MVLGGVVLQTKGVLGGVVLQTKGGGVAERGGGVADKNTPLTST